jgi:molybdopterin-guanine dinucleotide biosynthesis protein A
MGRPKAWLPFGPEYLVQRVARLVAGAADPVVVVAGPGQPLPDLPPEVLIVRDPVEGLGPLQGLATGLAVLPSQVELVYATSTDAPFLSSGWVRLLATRIGDHSIAIPCVASRLHPLAALYRRSTVLVAAERLLAAGRLKTTNLVDEVPFRAIGEIDLRTIDPMLSTLRNLNSPGDYLSALADSFGMAQLDQTLCS